MLEWEAGLCQVRSTQCGARPTCSLTTRRCRRRRCSRSYAIELSLLNWGQGKTAQGEYWGLTGYPHPLYNTLVNTRYTANDGSMLGRRLLALNHHRIDVPWLPGPHSLSETPLCYWLTDAVLDNNHTVMTECSANVVHVGSALGNHRVVIPYLPSVSNTTCHPKKSRRKTLILSKAISFSFLLNCARDNDVSTYIDVFENN